MVASVEKLGTERAFVDIYIERNKYWVEPVKYLKDRGLFIVVILFKDNQLVREYNTR